jgi:hypothetical protein
VRFSKAATDLALHVPWLFLCKNWRLRLHVRSIFYDSRSRSQGHRKFCNAKGNKRERYDLPGATSAQMIKTPAMLAKQMELAMHRTGKDCLLYQNEHCTLFENDLQHICPGYDNARKKKLAEFAAQYGFRLRFYRKGLFAIFSKRTPAVARDAGAFWPTCGVLSLHEVNPR